MRYDGLNHSRQQKAQDQRPKNFPPHGECHAERAQDLFCHGPGLEISSRTRQNDRASYDQHHASGAAETLVERQQLLACNIEGNAGNPDKAHDTGDEK
jgi:hypothetical protein